MEKHYEIIVQSLHNRSNSNNTNIPELESKIENDKIIENNIDSKQTDYDYKIRYII